MLAYFHELSIDRWPSSGYVGIFPWAFHRSAITIFGKHHHDCFTAVKIHRRNGSERPQKSILSGRETVSYLGIEIVRSEVGGLVSVVLGCFCCWLFPHGSHTCWLWILLPWVMFVNSRINVKLLSSLRNYAILGSATQDCCSFVCRFIHRAHGAVWTFGANLHAGGDFEKLQLL